MQTPFLAMALMTAATAASAGSFTVSNDRAAFEAALSEPYRVETFGEVEAFPITTGVLNAATDLVTEFGGPILPGRIQPGVTYSTPVGTSYFLNLDRGGGFEGAFLDGFYGGDDHRRLTLHFDMPAAAFGFDTNALAPNLELTVHFTDGSSQLFTTTVGEPTFFGFTSAGPDRITSAVIGGDGNGTFAFAVDNMTYTAAVPEPATWGLMAAGLLGVGRLARRRR